MVGSIITRGLVMIFGYAYPAYECFKVVEKNKPEIEQLQFWCQYWILVAVLTAFERFGDAFISWVPMYTEAKLAFCVHLWHPTTMGTTYVYNSFLRPYITKHETEIDRNMSELRTRAADIAALYWQKATNYSQTRILEIVQYIAALRPRPVQSSRFRLNNILQELVKLRLLLLRIPSHQLLRKNLANSNGLKSFHHLLQVSRKSVLPKFQQLHEHSEEDCGSAYASQPLSAEENIICPTNLKERSRKSVPKIDNPAAPSLQETVKEEAIRVTRSRLRKATPSGVK
ncbi:hypothetical protein Dimus_028082 [Dionaea muscipula]